MTWDEIYERADGAACGDATLKAKDEARHQVRHFVMEIGCPDPENDEIPEETIEEYCNAMKIQFDECGSIIGLEFPHWVEDLIHRRKDDEYLKQDILNTVHEIMDDGEITYEVSDEQMDMIMRRYEHDADCNVPYNVTIENAVREVLKGK